MLRFGFVAICLSSTVALADAPIIGGSEAKVGDFPTTVGIEVGQGLCTGELIAPDWVVTAGHCVDPAEVGANSQAELTASVRVHFDTVDLFSSAGKVSTAIETIEHPMHPNFEANTGLGHHDIGLIHLSAPVTDRKPALINLHHKDSPVGIVCTQVGFGVNTVGGQSAGTEFVIKNRTSTTCANQPNLGIPAPSDDNMLCFDQTDQKGQCQGDSGGPTFGVIGGATKIVAVTSYGDTNCTAWGADTRPEAEKDFLLQHIPDLECGSDADCASTDPRTCVNHQCLLQPFSPGGLGATCTGGSDCDAGTCATGPDTMGGSGTEMLCSVNCTPGADGACPSGFDCLDAGGGNGACWPSPPGSDDGGCCDAGNHGAATGALGALMFGLVVRRRRGSRQS